MLSLDARNRAPQICYFIFICSIIFSGCTSGNKPTTQVSNQLTIPENQISQENRYKIAKNIRATVQSDPCIEDIVLGLPESAWRCSTPQSREFLEVPPNSLEEPDLKIQVPPNSLEEPVSKIQATPEKLDIGIETIQWDEAYQYTDQYVSVCGPVVDSYFAASTDGQPTFLNLGKEYPDPDRFTVLIWGSNLESFLLIQMSTIMVNQFALKERSLNTKEAMKLKPGNRNKLK